MKNNIELGGKLHAILGSRNLTIWGLSELTGEHISKVARWCTGIEKPKGEDLSKIATALEISTIELKKLLEE